MAATNKLNDLQIRAIARESAKIPPAKGAKYTDGGGMFLFVTPGGALVWRLKYRVAGTEKQLSIGAYPEISLADARRARDEARAVIASGGDPAADKRAAKAAAWAPIAKPPTFGRYADELLAHLAPAQAYQTKAKWALHLGYAVKAFGDRPVGEIKPPEILAFLEAFKDRGHTLHSVRRKMSDVFARAAFDGACQGDPTHALKGFLLPAHDTNHAAITDPRRFGEMLRAIDGHAGHPSVRCGLLFLALTFQRPHMIREMTWAEVNWQAARWEIPAAKMKGTATSKRDHVVPLSAPALAVLRAMLPISGDGELVFPGRGENREMSDATLNKALRDRGFGSDEHVGHGFRASANTMIKEHLRGPMAEALGGIPGGSRDLQELIDLQLAHVVGNQTRRAYDRVQLMAERTALMTVWGAFIESCRARDSLAKVLPIVQ